MIKETKTIQELNSFIEAWVAGETKNLDHLFVMGTPGSGKSYKFRQEQKEYKNERFVILSGHLTPKELYNKFCEWSNQNIDLVVFDDVQLLTKNDKAAALMKQAMDGSDKRVVQYNTTQNLDQEEVVLENIRFAIITNDIGTRNFHVQALQTRAMTLFHRPKFTTTVEFAFEQSLITEEVYGFLRDAIPPKSGYTDLRTLQKLETLKSMGQDWKAEYKKYAAGQ